MWGRWSEAGARLRITRAHGLAELTFSGPLTRRAIEGSIEFISHKLRDCSKTLALMVLLQSSLRCLSGFEIEETVAPFADRTWLRLPAALVVPRDDLEEFRAYARRMSRTGLMRAVFTEVDPALTWARKRAVAEAAYLRELGIEATRPAPLQP